MLPEYPSKLPDEYVHAIGDVQLWRTTFDRSRSSGGVDLAAVASVPSIKYEIDCFQITCDNLAPGEIAFGPMVIDFIHDTVPPFAELARDGHMSRPDALVYGYTDGGDLILRRIVEIKCISKRHLEHTIRYKLKKFVEYTRILRGLNGHFRQALFFALGESMEIPPLWVPFDRQITVEFITPVRNVSLDPIKTDFNLVFTFVAQEEGK